jgi:predicted O-methyltransferase YrrM
LNLKGQLDLLDQFKYSEELLQFPLEKRKDLEYYYNNSSFESGDGEYLYNVVRHFKPKKIIEIGCGYSTLMIQNAINQNAEDNANDACNHVSIEPYEMPWLEQLPIELIRKKVEDVDLSVFETLEANDILFIDSSHMMRPQGDVLFEFLEILPELKSGVIVHVHDIFTPKDYPNKWILEDHRLWNEQYLLEAFLTCNTQFKIIGAVNYLMHNQYEALAATCPILKQQKDREPGSFWMVRT